MKKILVMASVMMLGVSGTWALGTDAGTTITNSATLSYDAGGVSQPDVNTAAPDSFVVDKKIDMILETDDNDQIEVTPGQTNRVTHYTFKNEGNADQNFTFSSSNLASGSAAANQADYDTDADNKDISNRVISCTGGTPTPATSAADGTVTIEVGHTVGTNATLTCTLSVTIPSAPTGANGDIMNVELLATAVDAAGVAEVETAGADTQGSVDIVFADGEAVQNGSTAGNLGDTVTEDNSTKGDTVGDGMDAARSGYIIQTPVLSLVKTSCVISDPVNGTDANAKRIPGAVIAYVFDINNTGSAAATSITITDDLVPELDETTVSVQELESNTGATACTCVNGSGNGTTGTNSTPANSQATHDIEVNTGTVDAGNHSCLEVRVELK